MPASVPLEVGPGSAHVCARACVWVCTRMCFCVHMCMCVRAMLGPACAQRPTGRAGWKSQAVGHLVTLAPPSATKVPGREEAAAEAEAEAWVWSPASAQALRAELWLRPPALVPATEALPARLPSSKWGWELPVPHGASVRI